MPARRVRKNNPNERPRLAQLLIYAAIETESKNMADRYVIALAAHTGGPFKPVIITQERGKSPTGPDTAAGGPRRRGPDGSQKETRTKIPDIAAGYGIKCDDLFGLFRREEWIF